jgi:hypothetical protein
MGDFLNCVLAMVSCQAFRLQAAMGVDVDDVRGLHESSNTY